MRALDIADCINETCPWSGKPVQADSLTEYEGQVVGFCNPGCRDKFESAVRHFEAVKASQGARRRCAMPVGSAAQDVEPTGAPRTGDGWGR